jgi:hypothetical protein
MDSRNKFMVRAMRPAGMFKIEELMVIKPLYRDELLNLAAHLVGEAVAAERSELRRSELRREFLNLMDRVILEKCAEPHVI